MHTFKTIDLTVLVFVTSMFFDNMISGNISINIPEEIVEELYLKYKEAAYDRGNISLRRLFKNNKQYEVHVEKLKEVNGFKMHNLMIKDGLRTDSKSLIYINNPVESKIPRAYLTLEEFKNILTDRVLKQRTKLTKTKATNDIIDMLLTNTSISNNITKLNNFKHQDGKNPATNVMNNKNNILSTKKFKVTEFSNAKHINFTRNVQDVTTNIYYTILTKKKAQDTINKTKSAIIVVSNITNIPATKRTKITNHNTLSTIIVNKPDVVVTKQFNFTPDIQNTTMNVLNKIVPSVKTEININVSESTLKYLNEHTKNVTINSEISNKPEVTILVSEEPIKYTTFKENEYITSNSHQSFTENITQVSTKKLRPSRKTTEKFMPESKTKKSPMQKRTTLGRPLVFMGN